MDMSNSICIDQQYANCYNSGPRRFLTPPPTWNSNQCPPAMPRSEKKPVISTQEKDDFFHVIHKVPAGDSPYVKAKHVQLIEKDPKRAISLFWKALNTGDRVDSALKDMAVVMKQLDRSDEAIEAIKSFRNICSPESQESLDNILLDLYKQTGRINEQIQLLQLKLKQVEEAIAFGGKKTKMARSQGKKIRIPVEKDYSRLLGNLAWVYMQQKDFKSAEEHYRKALAIEPDKNKQCNLAMCLMQMNKLPEAKFILQNVKFSSGNGLMDESHAKSYERALQMLVELEIQMKQTPEKYNYQFAVPVNKSTNRGAFTDIPSEKRSDFDWRRNHYNQSSIGQAARIPKVPLTQPRIFSSFDNYNGDQRKSVEKGSFCRKLSFEQNTIIVPQTHLPKEIENSKLTEKFQIGFNKDGFRNENVSENIETTTTTTTSNEILIEKLDALELGCGFLTQPEADIKKRRSRLQVFQDITKQ